MPATSNAAADLAVARHLAQLGVPVFVAALAADGHPERYGWPGLQPGTDETSLWRPGLALCAVMGHLFDVYDIDPRNGGDVSHEAVRKELGADVPRVYGRASTPSGGLHLWIAALGIGTRHGFRAGLDVQGARHGTGRGLAFIPPTVRPSKVDGVMRPYRWAEPPESPPQDDMSGAALAELITATHDAKRSAPPSRRECGTEVRATAIGAPYLRAAVAAELARVADAPEGTRNNTLNDAAFALGRFVADGRLNGAAVAEALAEAAVHAGLDYPASAATIRSAFAARGVAA
jgi:hypothetical protein